MANEDKNFDQYFRDKLINHEVKPSKLAWERLDSQLGKKGKASYIPFMKIAAVFIILLGVSYLVWQFSKTELTRPQTAEVIQFPDQNSLLESKSESQIDEEMTNGDQENSIVKPEKIETEKVQETSANKVQTKKQPVTDGTKELLADHPEQMERNQEQLIDIGEFDLPELKLDAALAMNDAPEQGYEEVMEYKVIIKSKGLKDEPAKQGLIGEIEDKVDKIGGFLNKVEQGFADLQDAKENLFASNIPKRERSK